MKTPTLLILAVGLTLSLGWSSAAHPATWQSIGPEGGGVDALAFAPSDPQVAYAGTLGAGVFRSDDGGTSWTAVNSGLGGNLFISSLAVNPRNPSIAYASTLQGLYETTSGGASWRPLPLGPYLVSFLGIDPTTQRIIYAATGTKVFRTADGGAHWTERDAGLTGELSAFDLDPDHPGTLYAGTRDSSLTVLPRIYKTIDGGGNWTLLPGLQTGYVSALARYRSTGTLYAATTNGLFATRDGGAAWTLLNQIPLDELVVTPSGTLYGNYGAEGVLRSVDDGTTWSLPDPSLENQPPGTIFSLALDATGDRLLAGLGFNGIYALDVDAGSGWKEANRGLRAAYITGLAVSSSGGSPLLFVATLGKGVFVSADGGVDFVARNTGLSFFDPPGFYVTGLAVDPKVPGFLAIGLSAFGSLVAGSSNAGRRWTLASPTCLTVDTLATAPPSTIFASSKDAFFDSSCPSVSCTARVSRDDGASFACLDGPRDVSAFLVDPLRPAIVYAADGDALWKSTDRGAHFALVASNLGGMITILAASPAAHETLYANVAGGGLLKSTDGGISWSRVDTNLPGEAFGLVVDPSNPALVYAALYGGVFKSLDGGATWSLLGDGLPALPNKSLALDSKHQNLYVGTYGAGVWALSLP